MELVPEMEKSEMREIYIRKGLSEVEATEVVDLLWPYKEAFLGPFTACLLALIRG